MVIFFLLGLLVTPSQLPEVFVPALLLCLFMLFIGRPVSVLASIKAVWCILAADRRCFLGRIAGSGIDCVFYLCCLIRHSDDIQFV